MSDPRTADVPDLVPARMVNEFTYCPRLFFLEWVQARFADNADTVEGRYEHWVVDRESGLAPLPGEGDVVRARSLLLSSPRLGLVARADIVEGDGGTVRPVDVKRGSVPDSPGRSWEPERVQLCVVGLLLREAGYTCDEGELYFAESRRRVAVVFDDDLVARTLGLLADLRLVAASDVPPPPLVDSPKCPRCSLVGICLPDEVNALSSRSTRPPRRLLPRDPAARPLYVTDQGHDRSPPGAGRDQPEGGDGQVGPPYRCVPGQRPRQRAGNQPAHAAALRRRDPGVLVQLRRLVRGHRRGPPVKTRF